MYTITIKNVDKYRAVSSLQAISPSMIWPAESMGGKDDDQQTFNPEIRALRCRQSPGAERRGAFRSGQRNAQDRVRWRHKRTVSSLGHLKCTLDENTCGHVEQRRWRQDRRQDLRH